jgi:hypothetical protein
MMENYIEYCKDGASMAMQPEGRMTAVLFLLIVDGHNSHVTLEVVHKAMQVGLDLLTLPSHTNHRLQPLDVSVFEPFKRAFKCYRDAWTLQNIGRGA